VEPKGASAVAHRDAGRRRTPALLIVLVLGLAALASVGIWAAVASTMTAGSGTGSTFDRVEVFTFVESGIVYVDPDSSEIIWRNRQRDSETIGKAPWRNPKSRWQDMTPNEPWGENRLLVGNPEHDVVSWVETVGGQRGDMVVVEAATGEVLARTPVEGEPDASVVISAVDDEAVYYTVMERAWQFSDVDPRRISVWRWAAGEEPAAILPSNSYFNDLSAGIRAVYTEEGVRFEDAETRPLSSRDGYSARTDWGGALSPDGRFWYGAETSDVLETATGDVIDLPIPTERDYGWTSADQLTLTVCEPGTGACQMHTCQLGPAADEVFCAPGLRLAPAAERSQAGLCLPYALACGSRMPVF
jgi:hypothetical protein